MKQNSWPETFEISLFSLAKVAAKLQLPSLLFHKSKGEFATPLDIQVANRKNSGANVIVLVAISSPVVAK